MAVPTIKRSGASSWIDAIRFACRMSENPRFRRGLAELIPAEVLTPLLAAWDTFCILFDAWYASDNFPGQVDGTAGSPEDVTGS